MKNRKVQVCTVMLCLSVILVASACSGKDFSREGNEGISILSDFPTKYIQKNQYLAFDTDIVVNSNVNSLHKSIAVKADFEGKTITPALLQESPDSEALTTDGKYYVHENGMSVYIENDYLVFNRNSELELDLNSSFSLLSGQYNADKYTAIENPDESAMPDEKGKINNLFSSLGIKNYKFYKLYLLDYQTLEENEIHSDAVGNDMPDAYREKWTEEDNGSYWLGTEIWQGLPVFCTSFYGGTTDEWAPIQILCTQNGLEKLQVLYYFNFMEESEGIVLKPFEEAAEALIEKYSMLLTDNQHIVKRAELFFGVNVNQEDIELEVVPIWVFTLREYQLDPEVDYTEYQELVNAETAEILEVGE